MEAQENKSAKKEPLVSFRKADILNGENTVIYGLDMEVSEGDFVYIVGKVGTGKTSIIRTMIGENRLEKGSGSVCGFSLEHLKEREIPYLRRKVGVVFQDFQLLMENTVEENLDFVLRATGWKDRNAADNRINEVLKAVGMSHKAHKMPHQLSGGEQQRIAIARSLLNRPQLIIADEPTGNLDPERSLELMVLFEKINELGTTVLIVTHEKELVDQFGKRVIMIDKGEVVSDQTGGYYTYEESAE